MSASSDKQALNIAVLTVSDTRTEATDTSGHYLVESLRTAGHRLAEKAIAIDDIYQLRAIVSRSTPSPGSIPRAPSTDGWSRAKRGSE